VRLVLIALGALAVAVAVWSAVAADYVTLFGAAWWAGLVAVSFPACMVGWYFWENRDRQ